MESPSHDRIVNYIVKRFYDEPLITNIWRGHYIEALIFFALCEKWEHPSGWGTWDLENPAGVRLEVKQSAALQNWGGEEPYETSSAPRFDIKPKTAWWDTDEETWIECVERHAHIYVFAWHPETRRSVADHRRFEQWRFFVVDERLLPEGQKSISLNPLKELAPEITYEHLAATVDAVVSNLPSLKGNEEE